jgi:hypothetical protein
MTRALTGAAFAVGALLVGGCGGTGSNKAGAATPSGGAQTLHLHTTPGPGGFIPLVHARGGRAPQGAGFAKTEPVADESNARTGMQDTICFDAGVRGRQNCRVTLTLERGTIIAEGIFADGGGLGGTLAVVGGTGAYNGARGTYETSVPGPTPQVILVRLVTG